MRYQLELLTLLRELAREKGVAVVLSLHELALARRVADTLVCVRDGVVDRAGSPEEIFTALRSRGIYVRYFKKPRIDNYLRVTIGTDAEMERLFAALKDILEGH